MSTDETRENLSEVGAPEVDSSEVISSEVDSSEVVSSESGRLLYCHCAYSRVVPKDVKAEVLRTLAASGRAFDAVPDLCEAAARQDPGLNKLAEVSEEGVDIVACYPRAVRWLFHAAEAALPEDGVRIHNMRTDSAEEVLTSIGLTAPETVP